MAISSRMTPEIEFGTEEAGTAWEIRHMTTADAESAVLEYDMRFRRGRNDERDWARNRLWEARTLLKAVRERDAALARVAELEARVERLQKEPRRQIDFLIDQMNYADAPWFAMQERTKALMTKLGLLPGDLDAIAPPVAAHGDGDAGVPERGR